MKRRDFSISMVTAVAGAGLGWSGLVSAQTSKLQAERDYRVLDKAAPTEAPAGKIEVVEFFGYYCAHCNAFEPTLDAWTKTLPKDIAFKRVPVAFQDSVVPFQRLFYSLEAMGLVPSHHGKVFAAIHKQRVELGNAAAIADWIGQQGVDKAKFMEQYNSFSVATKCTKAKQLQNAYQIEGVPTLGIAGRYWTDGAMTGSNVRALQVVDALVAEIRAKRLPV
jgi:thiol:disulfide interchange protein DsbA